MHYFNVIYNTLGLDDTAFRKLIFFPSAMETEKDIKNMFKDTGFWIHADKETEYNVPTRQMFYDVIKVFY